MPPWSVGFIRRFMLFFGPISSLFDVVTLVLMGVPCRAGAVPLRMVRGVPATQTLVIFAITRRIPFLRSRPSTPMLLAALDVATVGAVLPATPSPACSASRRCRAGSSLPWS